MIRAEMVGKGGVATLLGVLLQVDDAGAPIADVIGSLLSSLAEDTPDLTHKVSAQQCPSPSSAHMQIVWKVLQQSYLDQHKN